MTGTETAATGTSGPMVPASVREFFPVIASLTGVNGGTA